MELKVGDSRNYQKYSSKEHVGSAIVTEKGTGTAGDINLRGSVFIAENSDKYIVGNITFDETSKFGCNEKLKNKYNGYFYINYFDNSDARFNLTRDEMRSKFNKKLKYKKAKKFLNEYGKGVIDLTEEIIFFHFFFSFFLTFGVWIIILILKNCIVFLRYDYTKRPQSGRQKMTGNIGRFEAISVQKTTMVTGSKEVLEHASDRHFLDNFKEQLNNFLKLNFEAVIPQMNIRR